MKNKQESKLPTNFDKLEKKKTQKITCKEETLYIAYYKILT